MQRATLSAPTSIVEIAWRFGENTVLRPGKLEKQESLVLEHSVRFAMRMPSLHDIALILDRVEVG